MARRSGLPRRTLILRTAGVLGAAALAPAFLARTALAQGGMAKKEPMKYQDKPNGTQKCADCIHFIPASSGKGPGTCQIVEGAISPNGWCIEWQMQPKKPAAKG